MLPCHLPPAVLLLGLYLVDLRHLRIGGGPQYDMGLGLAQAGQFGERLKSYANLRAVLWGHVHQQAHQRLDGIEWMSTPSTCVQFKPGSAGFALDHLAPGYRYIELHADGRIVTEVERIPQREFSALG